MIRAAMVYLFGCSYFRTCVHARHCAVNAERARDKEKILILNAFYVRRTVTLRRHTHSKSRVIPIWCCTQSVQLYLITETLGIFGQKAILP